jgi:hypothetical protein
MVLIAGFEGYKLAIRCKAKCTLDTVGSRYAWAGFMVGSRARMCAGGIHWQ